MPFEIEEVIIQMEVNTTPRPQPAAHPNASGLTPTEATDEIVAKCVRAVLHAMKESRER